MNIVQPEVIKNEQSLVKQNSHQNGYTTIMVTAIHIQTAWS